MRKSSFFQNPGLFILVVIIAFAACHSNSSSNSSTDSLQNQVAGETILHTQNGLLTGYLDTLWIDSASFRQLNKRVTFRFYIDSINHLTLHGWSSDTVVYDPSPDVILLNGRASSTVQYGKGNYFGNLVLKNKDVDSIRRAIKKTKSPYVLFAPQDPATTNGQINYSIFLTNDDPHPLVKIPKPQVVSTGLFTNPSPPRNSN